MTQSGSRRLVEFVEATFDERLRGVARCDEGALEWFHLRADLEAERRQTDLYHVAERREGTDRHLDGAEVYVPDDAVVLRFPTGSGREVILSLEPHTPLEPGFIRACRNILRGEQPWCRDGDPERGGGS